MPNFSSGIRFSAFIFQNTIAACTIAHAMLTIESAPYIFSVFLSVIKYPALVKINTITQIINGTYFIRFTLFYKKIYLHTNNTASTYINGVIFFALPQITLITT